MKILAIPVQAAELRPGDLFSTVGPKYWANRDPNAVGEKVYIRTDAPTPDEQAHEPVFRITIESDTYCACGKPLHYASPELEKRVRALVDAGGEYLKVKTDDGRVFMVQRHWLQLHSPSDEEIAKMGQEVEV